MFGPWSSQTTLMSVQLGDPSRSPKLAGTPVGSPTVTDPHRGMQPLTSARPAIRPLRRSEYGRLVDDGCFEKEPTRNRSPTSPWCRSAPIATRARPARFYHRGGGEIAAGGSREGRDLRRGRRARALDRERDERHCRGAPCPAREEARYAGVVAHASNAEHSFAALPACPRLHAASCRVVWDERRGLSVLEVAVHRVGPHVAALREDMPLHGGDGFGASEGSAKV